MPPPQDPAAPPTPAGPAPKAPHPFLGFSAPPGSTLRELVAPQRLAALLAPLDLDAPPPWLDLAANNHGFFSPHDLPWTPPADDDGRAPFVVAILGGSVAHWLTLTTGDVLAAGLEASGATGGRTVHVLNAASAGFKQPQTLLCVELLLSMGQQIDAVLVVDGFNEVALGFTNWEAGFEPTSPSIDHLDRATDGVERFRRRDEGTDPAAAVADAVDHWWRCSTLTRAVLAASGIPVLHVLQPNQYFGSHPFSEAERLAVLSDTTPYRRGVELGYPGLRARLPTLRAAGYRTLDATGLFDDDARHVYADRCCHLNQRGNDLLVEAVSAPLAAAIAGAVDDRTTASQAPGAARAPSEPTTGRGPARRAMRRRRRGRGVPGDDLYPLW